MDKTKAKTDNREMVDKFVRAYNSLLEENKELRQRRIAALNIIEEQRVKIYELEKRVRELSDGA